MDITNDSVFTGRKVKAEWTADTVKDIANAKSFDYNKYNQECEFYYNTLDMSVKGKINSEQCQNLETIRYFKSNIFDDFNDEK